MITLQQASERFLNEHPAGYKDGYRYQQNVCLRAVMRHFAPEMKLKDVVPEIIEEALSQLIQQRHVSTFAQVSYRSALRRFFLWCFESGLSAVNCYPGKNGRPRKQSAGPGRNKKNKPLRVSKQNQGGLVLTHGEVTSLIAMKYSMDFFSEFLTNLLQRVSPDKNITQKEG